MGAGPSCDYDDYYSKDLVNKNYFPKSIVTNDYITKSLCDEQKQTISENCNKIDAVQIGGNQEEKVTKLTADIKQLKTDLENEKNRQTTCAKNLQTAKTSAETFQNKFEQCANQKETVTKLTADIQVYKQKIKELSAERAKMAKNALQATDYSGQIEKHKTEIKDLKHKLQNKETDCPKQKLVLEKSKYGCPAQTFEYIGKRGKYNNIWKGPNRFLNEVKDSKGKSTMFCCTQTTKCDKGRGGYFAYFNKDELKLSAM